MRYSEAAINATLNHLNKVGKDVSDGSIVGIYKTKLMATQRTEVGKRDLTEDMTFVEPSKTNVSNPISDDDDEDVRDMKNYWGENYSDDDYRFLESKLSEWEDSYSHATKAEQFILKELCHRELELRNARIEGKNVDPILKSVQSLLNDGGLKPTQAKAADSGKVHDSWGTLIRQIEETTPAEFYKDKKLFKDFDQIEKKYIVPFIVRSIKNFILGSRDFNISEEDVNDEDEYANLEVDDGNESSTLE
jgi:hypothetical protein